MDNNGKTIGDESPWNPYVQGLIGQVSKDAFLCESLMSHTPDLDDES
jgi:hypothetical protein